MRDLIFYTSAIFAFIFTCLLGELLSSLMFDFNISKEDKPIIYYSILFIIFITFTIMSIIFYHIIKYYIY